MVIEDILFILFVNTIRNFVTCAKSFLFTDDMKIYLKISSPICCQVFLPDLVWFKTKLWHKLWNDSFNPFLYNYFYHGTSLNRIFFFKYFKTLPNSFLRVDFHFNIMLYLNTIILLVTLSKFLVSYPKTFFWSYKVLKLRNQTNYGLSTSRLENHTFAFQLIYFRFSNYYCHRNISLHR